MLPPSLPTATFSSVALGAIKIAANTDVEGLQVITEQYVELYDKIGAPPPDQITEREAFAVANIGDFRETDGDWTGYRARLHAEERAHLDAINAFLPLWTSRSEDKPNLWMSDTGTLTEDAKRRLTQHFQIASPSPDTSYLAAFRRPPVEDPLYMKAVVDAMARSQNAFLWSLGDLRNPEWTWGPSLTMLSGLGLDAVRRFASKVSADPVWQHWATCSDQELVDDILKCRNTSGYPAGLLRADFRVILSVMASQNITQLGTTMPHVPRWFRALVTLHILKHVRFWPGSNPRLFVAYGGSHSFFPISPDHVSAAFSGGGNLRAALDMCKMLGIPCSQSSTNRSWLDDVTAIVLKNLVPAQLPSPEQLDTCIEYVPAPGVTISQCYEDRRDHRWCSPGVEATNIATVDLKTGEVNRNAVVGGTALLSYRWPIQHIESTAYDEWWKSLPDKVEPMRASHVLFNSIHNINDLGEREGLCGIIDAIVTSDLLRLRLSAASLDLNHEFPLIFALPMGSEDTTTTNQGKTTLCRLLGSSMSPSIKVIPMMPSASPPAMRSLATNLETDGTAVIDEYRNPSSHEHLLSQASLQSMATGSLITVGRALENHAGFRIRHPLFLAGKISPTIPDLQNRMVGIFMDTVTEATTLTQDELNEIGSGRPGFRMRLSHLLWMHQNGMEEKLLKTKMVPGTWRMRSHLAIAHQFASADSINRYFKLMLARADQQASAAEDSGLAEQIGSTVGFDPQYYWYNAHPLTIEMLASKSKAGPIRVSDALRVLVEDGDKRKFDVELRNFRANEKSAGQILSRQVKAAGGALEREGARLVITSIKDSKGRSVAAVSIIATPKPPSLPE